MNTYEVILRAIKKELDSKAAKFLELNYDGIGLYYKNILFEESIKRGMYHAMKITLTYDMIDPCADNNYVILCASEYGHY